MTTDYTVKERVQLIEIIYFIVNYDINYVQELLKSYARASYDQPAFKYAQKCHFVNLLGAIYLVGKNNRVVLPGSDVEIKWTFDDDLDKLIVRVWNYATKNEELASIIRKGSVQETNSTLSTGAEFNEKGTMVLRNVDDSYNGTYYFQVLVTGSTGDISYVDVFVAGRLTIIGINFTLFRSH